MRSTIPSGEYTHMMFKSFAVGAALLAALVPCVARADLIDLFGPDSGTITFTSPTSLSSSGDLIGDACWYSYGPAGTWCGSWGFPNFSVTALPGTSALLGQISDGNDTIANFGGTADWTAIEGYPASPELIGTISVGVMVLDPSSLIAQEFAADFPAGSVDTITVLFGSGAATCGGPIFGEPPCLGIVNGQILTPTPEPATLSIFGAALGIFLMTRRVVRRPTKGPSEDLAGA